MRGSIRRPILVYAVVTSVACTAAVITLASLTMVRVVRVDREGLLAEAALHLRAAHGGAPAPSVFAAAASVDPRSLPEGSALFPLGTSTTTALALVPRAGLTSPDVARAIRGLFLTALVVAIAFGAVSGWMTARLVLAPLRDLARNSRRSAVIDSAADEGADELQAVAGAFRDALREVREEKRAVERRNVELSSLQRQVARADKLASIGRLTAGVAHEIGNPLAAVMGYLRLLQSGALSPSEQDDVLTRSSRELERIHGTIRKLLTYTRSGSGTAVEPQPTSTADVVRETWSLAKAHTALRDVSVQLDVPEDTTPDAMVDPRALQQVLVNLVINAGQALAEHPDKQLRIAVDREGPAIAISVDDSGPGVPASIRGEIFDPFFTTKSESDGTGLGLSVSRALVESMDGQVDLEDSPLGGARFVVRVPKLTRTVTAPTKNGS